MTRVHLEVTGLVQGVGFRWFLRQRARALGLAGWVANRDDGAVEVAAEGSEDAIRSLLEAARAGPAGARVDHVRELPAVAGDLPTTFTVLR